MIRRSSLIALEIIAALVMIFGLGAGFLAWRLSQGPILVPALKQHVERELSVARAGRNVRIERVELAWAPGGLEVRARNVQALATNGSVLSSSRTVTVGTDLPSLLLGRFKLTSAVFDGGEVTATMAENGTVAIAFGPRGTPPDFVIPAPPPGETLTQRVNRLLDGMSGIFRPVGVGARLQSLSVRGARLNIINEASQTVWRGDDAAFDLARDAKSLKLSAQAALQGPRGPAPASIEIVTDTDMQAAVVSLVARGVKPAALLAGHSVPLLQSLDAPVTAALTIGLDRKRGVTRLEGDFAVGRGVWRFGEGRLAIEKASVRGAYDLSEDVLSVDELMLNGARSKAKGRVTIQNASAFLGRPDGEPARFDIAVPALELDAPGMFAQPIALNEVAAKGAISLKDQAILFERVSGRVEQARLALSGKLYWKADKTGAVKPGLDLDGTVDGDLSARDVVKYWPVGLASGARGWADRSITDGIVSNVVLRTRITPGDLGRRGLPNESLSLSFAFRGGQVRYLPGMTPITAGRGTGQLKGNRFDVTGVTGKIGGLSLSNGKVELPQLFPRGALTTYAGRVEGEAKSMIGLLLEAPIGLQERLPVDPATVVGRGGANFALMRRLRDDGAKTEPSLLFKVDAQLDGVGGTAKDNAFIVANWRLSAKGDEKSMTFSGPLRLGASDVTLAWTESFAPKAPVPSSYVIDGRFTPEDLERFGLPIADYADGAVGVQLRGGGRGYAISAADVKLDFGGADVDILDRVWVKPRGQAASMQFAVKGQGDGALQLSDIVARGPGLAVEGAALIGADKRVASFQLSRVSLGGGRTDVALNGKRDRAGVLRINGEGASFDASPFVGGGDDPLPISKPQRKGPPEQIAMELKAKRLLFQGGAELADARLSGAWVGANMLRLNMRGSEPRGGKFAFALGAEDGGATGPIVFHSGDAGFVVKALTGSDHVIGGGVHAQGTWRVAEQRADFSVRAGKFQVVRLPVMARLLSSVASLRGLSDLMNGDGIDFSVFEGRMTLMNDRLSVAEARASGPSLGVTAKGSVGLEEGKLAMDGVLVPSYGLNSMLGNVPVLGALLTSRRGEGVIGITYSISGPTETPRVAVNPLSAITPGIFRRIFEPFSSQRPETAGGEGNGG